MECRSAPAPYQKKEWHSHIAPFKKGSGTPSSLFHEKVHSLIALFFVIFFKISFLTSIHTWIWKFKRNFMSSWKYLCFQEYINHRSDGETSLFTEKECQKKNKISEKKEWKKRAPHIFALLKNMSATPTSLLSFDQKECHSSFAPNFGSGTQKWPLKECPSLTHWTN